MKRNLSVGQWNDEYVAFECVGSVCVRVWPKVFTVSLMPGKNKRKKSARFHQRARFRWIESIECSITLFYCAYFCDESKYFCQIIDLQFPFAWGGQTNNDDDLN